MSRKTVVKDRREEILAEIARVKQEKAKEQERLEREDRIIIVPVQRTIFW